MNKRFRTDADLLLSGLTWGREEKQAVLSAVKGEQPKMKKKISAGLILAAALLLTAAVALAVGLTKSAEYATMEKARGALTQRYGLTQEMLTLFDAQTTGADGKTTVVFSTGHSAFVNSEAVGMYTVVIGSDGNAEASWTHDGADPAQWETADLTSAVWGAPQLRQALDRYAVYQQFWKDHENFNSLTAEEQTALLTDLQAAIAPLELPQEAAADAGNAMPTPRVTPTVPTGDGGVLAAAREALKERYALTDDALALFSDSVAPDTTDGQTAWEAVFRPVELTNLDSIGIADWRWIDTLNHKLGSYNVLVNAADNAILATSWSLDGTDDASAYDESNWGSAKAYDGHILPWVLKLLRVNEPIIARYPEDQTDWFTVEDAAAYDQAFRNAGFDAKTYNHTLPQQGDLTAEQAAVYAKQAMHDAYGLTEEQMAAYTLTTEYCTDDGGTWYLNFYSANGMGRVALCAANGEILTVSLDSGAAGNG